MARRNKDTDRQPAEPVRDSLLDRMQGFDEWRTGGAGPVAQPPPADAATPPGTMPLPAPQAPNTSQDGDQPAVVQQVVPYLGWEPGPVRVTRTGRAFRWTVLLVIIALGAGAAFLIRWVPTIAEGEAEQVATEFQAALGGLSEAIPAMDAALPVLADPARDVEDSLISAARFQGAAANLGMVARDPLPSTLPLVPRGPLDELEPLRDELALVAGRAELISTRISRVIDYRAKVERAFILPDLTNRASLEESNDLAVALAAMLAETLEILTQLPEDPLLDGHRRQAQSLLEWLKEWEIRYLETLRSEDDIATAFAVRDARRRVTTWRGAITEPLEEVRLWLSRELDGLRADIQRASALVP